MTEPIRVLCVFSRLDRGGAETMCMNLYRHMDHSKVQFDFVKHTEDEGAYEQEIRELGGNIYAAPRFQGLNYLTYQKWWNRHFQAHPEHQIVHGHFFTISAVYFRFAHRNHRITIGHSHSTDQKEKKLKTKIKKKLQRLVERESDYCFACSEDAGKWLFPHKAFTVLKNAINTNLFAINEAVRNEVRDELKLSGKLVLGAVGSLTSVKNPYGMIEIFRAVLAQNKNAVLLWIGDGPYRTAIEQKLVEEQLSNHVIMTGVRSDVYRLMQAMDVFLLPSIWEGLPVVLIEAQAAGLPCLVSDTVTKEANLTGLCTYLPNDQPEAWVKPIANMDGSRLDTSAAIMKSGYDIRTTAKWLEEFYVNL